MLRLGAALFNGDHARLGEEVARIESAGLDFVHLDVFDGHLVPDLGFSPRTIAALRPLSNLPFEVHLAATDPLRFMPQLREAGVDVVLLHIESAPLLYETVSAAREEGLRIGLVFTLGTPVGLLAPVVTLVDAVLLLARVTGEGARGAEFNPLVIPRVSAARKIVDAFGTSVDVQVAGGIRREHVPHLLASGASSLALGGGLYKAPDMAEETREIRALAAKGVA